MWLKIVFLNCVCRKEGSQLENREADKERCFRELEMACLGDSGLWGGGVGLRLSVCFIVYPREKDFLHFWHLCQPQNLVGGKDCFCRYNHIRGATLLLHLCFSLLEFSSIVPVLTRAPSKTLALLQAWHYLFSSLKYPRKSSYLLDTD